MNSSPMSHRLQQQNKQQQQQQQHSQQPTHSKSGSEKRTLQQMLLADRQWGAERVIMGPNSSSSNSNALGRHSHISRNEYLDTDGEYRSYPDDDDDGDHWDYSPLDLDFPPTASGATRLVDSTTTSSNSSYPLLSTAETRTALPSYDDLNMHHLNDEPMNNNTYDHQEITIENVQVRDVLMSSLPPPSAAALVEGNTSTNMELTPSNTTSSMWEMGHHDTATVILLEIMTTHFQHD